MNKVLIKGGRRGREGRKESTITARVMKRKSSKDGHKDSRCLYSLQAVYSVGDVSKVST